MNRCPCGRHCDAAVCAACTSADGRRRRRQAALATAAPRVPASNQMPGHAARMALYAARAAARLPLFAKGGA